MSHATPLSHLYFIRAVLTKWVSNELHSMLKCTSKLEWHHNTIIYLKTIIYNCDSDSEQLYFVIPRSSLEVDQGNPSCVGGGVHIEDIFFPFLTQTDTALCWWVEIGFQVSVVRNSAAAGCVWRMKLGILSEQITTMVFSTCQDVSSTCGVVFSEQVQNYACMIADYASS